MPTNKMQSKRVQPGFSQHLSDPYLPEIKSNRAKPCIGTISKSQVRTGLKT